MPTPAVSWPHPHSALVTASASFPPSSHLAGRQRLVLMFERLHLELAGAEAHLQLVQQQHVVPQLVEPPGDSLRRHRARLCRHRRISRCQQLQSQEAITGTCKQISEQISGSRGQPTPLIHRQKILKVLNG